MGEERRVKEGEKHLLKDTCAWRTYKSMLFMARECVWTLFEQSRLWITSLFIRPRRLIVVQGSASLKPQEDPLPAGTDL